MKRTALALLLVVGGLSSVFQQALAQRAWEVTQSAVLDTSMPLNALIHAVPQPGTGQPHDILAVPDSAFKSREQTEDLKYDEGWIRFTIVNASDAQLSNMYTCCRKTDSFRLYKRVDDELRFIGQSGLALDKDKRDLKWNDFFVRDVITPGDTAEYFAHFWMSDASAWQHIYHVRMEGTSAGVSGAIADFTLQSFYSGIMMVFFLVSLMMFLSFKDRVFISYALMLLFLNLYSMHAAGVLNTLVMPTGLPSFFYSNYIYLAGIVLFATLFLEQYTDLKLHLPRLRKVFRYFSFYLVVYTLVYGLFLFEMLRSYNLLNPQLLVWILFYVYLITHLVVRKVRAARVLLLSIGLLAIGGVIMVMSVTGLFSMGDLGVQSLQIGTLAFSSTLFYGLFTKIREIQDARTQLRVEKEQSDAVLFNVLPEDIATELKETGESKARYLEQVTVLFTDFKNFTSISSDMTPQDLVAELNTLFSAFDAIIRRHGLEKIKTIGDAYMVAGGLRDSHAHEANVVIRAALEMQQLVQERSEERKAQGLPNFTMRAGIHTGSVVAGVVGVEKFQYDIWGDTVNMASRMESNGVVGKVNISDATHTILKDSDEFSFESRGTVEVKGKGAVQMWLVELTQMS